MTTVTTIADAAFDAVNVAITDVIDDATIAYDTQGAYDASTGTFTVTANSITGRALFDTETPAADIFPDAVIGPREQMVLLEGFSAEIKEGYKLTVNSVDYEVKAAQKIVGSNSLQYAVVLER
jgi:hypothetical protein